MDRLKFLKPSLTEKSPETAEKLEKPVYLLPIMTLSTIYVLVDSVLNCCEEGTYTEAGLTFSATNIIYILYIFSRPYCLSEVTLVGLLDYDTLFTFTNFCIWTTGLSLLTFTENAVFNDLNLGFMGTWGCFLMASTDFFQTWDLVPDIDTAGHGTFTYPVVRFIFGLLAFLYTISTVIECYGIGNCDNGEDLAPMFGAFTFVVLIWLQIFRYDNPGRTYVALLLVGTWLLGVFLLTYDVPFFIDGQVVPNFFAMTWAALGVSFGFLTVSDDFITTKLTLVVMPPMICFTACAILLLAGQPNMITICEDFTVENVLVDLNLTDAPTRAPLITLNPTLSPTISPTQNPTISPTLSPTFSPTVTNETARPTDSPTLFPTSSPTFSPTEFNGTFAPVPFVDTENEERCQIYQLALLGVNGLSFLIVGVVVALTYIYGTADAPHTVRKGCKILLVLWLGPVFLTFPFASPVSLVSSPFLAIWFGFGVLLYFSYFSLELTELEGGNFEDLDHFIYEGKAGNALKHLGEMKDHSRYFLYVIFLGSLTHAVASAFACVNDDLFDEGESRTTPQEIFSLTIGIVSLMLLSILVCFFGPNVDFAIKVCLFFLWPVAAIVPIVIGPFDELQGNGYLSTFVTIGAVLGYILLE